VNCENCSVEHDGTYASGRFCSQKCSRGFSTKSKRELISEKVSLRLRKEKICNFCKQPWIGKRGSGYSAGRRCPNCRETAARDRPWEIVKLGTKKSRLIRERGHRCEECKNEMWLGKPITLEMHHINGDGKDNRKENLQLLCPNCHSMTPNFGWRKKFSPVVPQVKVPGCLPG